jgi:ankyrin repeat protein
MESETQNTRYNQLLHRRLLDMAKRGNLLIVQDLIENHKISPYVADEHWNTPLHLAVRQNQPHVVRYLLSLDLRPNFRNFSELTPLHIACAVNNIETVELLINHGEDVNSQDRKGNTPLHVAAIVNN